MRKWYLVGGIILVVVAAIGYRFIDRRSAMAKFAAGGSVQMGSNMRNNIATDGLKPNYCPDPQTLVKQNLKWASKDDRWESDTASSATEILNFAGAQWVGIKIGKIICLYQTNEAASFPLALEQVKSQAILEPHEAGWSSLINNRRLCKSASVADCPYFIEPPRDVSNIYDEIKYAPASRN